MLRPVPPLRESSPSDPGLVDILGYSHRRFQVLVEEAQVKAREFYRRTLGRPAAIEEVIDEVFAAVERDGDAAVVRYVLAFDGATIPVGQLRVAAAEIDAAWERCPSAVRDAI